MLSGNFASMAREKRQVNMLLHAHKHNRHRRTCTHGSDKVSLTCYLCTDVRICWLEAELRNVEGRGGSSVRSSEAQFPEDLVAVRSSLTFRPALVRHRLWPTLWTLRSWANPFRTILPGLRRLCLRRRRPCPGPQSREVSRHANTLCPPRLPHGS